MKRIDTAHERSARAARPAFTLIELLVVIAIIALLVSILLPSLQKAKDMAKEVICMSNLSGISKALGLYESENSGYYPTGAYASSANGPPPGFDSFRKAQWFFVLRDYSARPAGGTQGEVADAHNIYRCPMAISFPPHAADWGLYSCSYIPNDVVLDHPVHNKEKPKPVKSSSIRKTSQQMVMADWWNGAECDWGNWGMVGSDPAISSNEEVWYGESTPETPDASWTQRIKPWHGGGKESNLLMADYSVKASVTSDEGVTYRYQNPTVDDDGNPL